MKRTLSRMVRAHAICGPLGPKSRRRFFALALAGEAGELANLVKKEWRGDRIPKKEFARKFASELSDIANYAFMLARVERIRLEHEMECKFREVEGRPEYQRLVARDRRRKRYAASRA